MACSAYRLIFERWRKDPSLKYEESEGCCYATGKTWKASQNHAFGEVESAGFGGKATAIQIVQTPARAELLLKLVWRPLVR